MTAIVAILNKSAVAISADSAAAVGIQSKRKIYNNANKLFNLAIGSPIGIMIYNNAEFLGIPWETLVKEYRKYTNNGTFGTVEAYRDNYLKYLLKYPTRFFSGKEEDLTLAAITTDTFSALDQAILIQMAKIVGVTTIQDLRKHLDRMQPQDKLALVMQSVAPQLAGKLEEIAKVPFCPGFGDADKTELVKKFETSLRHQVGFYFARKSINDKGLNEILFKIIVETAVRQHFASSYSGLVFTGFGEEEIFPSLASMHIGGIINGKLRYGVVVTEKISGTNPANISPFAQTDIMRTFIQGIDPEVRRQIPIILTSAMEQFKQTVVTHVDGSTPQEVALKQHLEAAIKGVITTVETKLDRSLKRNHDDPMLASVSTLSKEDLAAMAESLIHTTYLHRRASFSDESVGGPVDVAVITKGDGFIWIKRKHYFDPALNLNYRP